MLLIALEDVNKRSAIVLQQFNPLEFIKQAIITIGIHVPYTKDLFLNEHSLNQSSPSGLMIF